MISTAPGDDRNRRWSVCYIEPLSPNTHSIVSHGELQWVECRAVQRYRWLLHAFSTRRGGTSQGATRGLNLGFRESQARAPVEKNRRLFLQAVGASNFTLAALRQIHSTHIFRVARLRRKGIEYFPAGSARPLARGERLPAGDALITQQPGILLSIRTADCLPVLLVDPVHRAVAALHAGWRGTLGRLAEKVVGVMRGQFHSDPRRMIAVIGPGIRACCYSVGEEVVSAFRGRFVASEGFFRPVPSSDSRATATASYPLQFLSNYPPGHAPAHLTAVHLDLAAAIQNQLLGAGLVPSRIHDVGLCTSCRTDLFFSHRQEGPRTGRMMAVIAIRNG